MRTTEEWLEDKLTAYNEEPKEALEQMLSTTNDVIEQFINAPTSKPALGLLIACMEHNKLFLKKANIID